MLFFNTIDFLIIIKYKNGFVNPNFSTESIISNTQ